MTRWVMVAVLLLLTLTPQVAAGQTATPSTEETELAPGLVIVGHHAEKDRSGFLTVVALVENRSDKTYAAPTILATFLDSSGDILGETTLLAFVPEVPAQQRSFVLGVLIGDDAQSVEGFDSVEFSLSYGAPGQLNDSEATSTSLSVKVGDSKPGDYGAEVRTKVTNNGETSVSGVIVAVIVTASDGSLLDVGYGPLSSTLRSGQSANVSVRLTFTNAVPASANTEAYAAARR